MPKFSQSAHKPAEIENEQPELLPVELEKEPEQQAAKTGKSKVMYRVVPAIAAKYTFLSTIIPVDLTKGRVPGAAFVSVSLLGDIVKPAVHTKDGPGVERIVKAATQAQLKYLYEQGNLLIEQYND